MIQCFIDYMSLDLRIFYFFNNLTGQSHFFDAIAVFFSSYLQYFLVAAFLLFLVFSKRSRKEKIIIFSAVGLSVILARGILVEIIRFFYHHPRPFITHSINQLIFADGYSFPSGHAAFFFAFAAAVYFYNKKLGLWFLGASIFMSLARVVAGVHYPLDILGGAIVGILVAFSVFWFWPYK